MSSSEIVIDAEGYVAKGTAVASKAELLELLEAWLKASKAATIGPIGNYGGKQWISITLDKHWTGVLNADTKREAVEEYVNDARMRKADIPWSVIRNRKGRWNKLVFREGDDETPGWYCYLQPADVGPRRL